MLWPNRPPIKGSSQAAPAGSQGEGLSASSGGCRTPERRGVCAGTSPPRGKRSAQQQQAAKGPEIGVAWRLRHRTGAQPAGQKHGARRLRWAGLLKLQIPVLTNLKHSKTLHRIPPRKGYVLSRNLLKSVVGATLLVASLWAGAQPAELVQAAEQGNAKAQLKLGLILGRGLGVPQNDAEAVKWYRLAAEQGDTDAQYLMGVMLENGQGVPQNEAEAVKWYRLAAEQGMAEAQGNLGLMLENGLGVPQNDAEAVKWYRLAAEQGDADAQYNLGLMLAKGNGVAPDRKQAYFWALLAAAQNQKYKELRDLLAERLKLTDRNALNEMQKKAAAWKPKPSRRQ